MQEHAESTLGSEALGFIAEELEAKGDPSHEAEPPMRRTPRVSLAGSERTTKIVIFS
jgi:hypothetical protein